MTTLAILLAFTLGGSLGYLYAVTRTPHLIAHMTPAELRALATRVSRRRGETDDTKGR